MHAAQTAWLANRQNRPDLTGGWLAAKFHLYSWALSAHGLAWWESKKLAPQNDEKKMLF
jgi:hypothetical protein